LKTVASGSSFGREAESHEWYDEHRRPKIDARSNFSNGTLTNIYERTSMTIELTRQEEFAVLTLNRPSALNALNFSLLREIGEALDTVATSNARALLITGAGNKAFCAGADVKELSSKDLLEQKRSLEFGQSTFAKLDTLPIPSVALVNGYAFGGGLELALACTFRLATPNAKIGFPEIKLGLVPGYGGTQRLPRVIGTTRALELMMTGRPIPANEALALGLINRMIEGDPIEDGIAFAREFSCHGLPALQFVRDAVQRACDTPLHEGFKIESDLATLSLTTADAKEGMNAFIEKRKAIFTDK
jgi:enoyl-CoA hydratase